MRAILKTIFYAGGVALLLFVFSAFAYSPHYTHPDLTEEIIKFYNSGTTSNKIDARFISALRQGSVDEDTDPRWINHFYDPQSGEGWTSEHLGQHDKEIVQKTSQTLLAIGFTPLSAPQWAVDQQSQNLFINYGWNHTWQKAIYDYVNGNEEKAFESLGYTLHLIEDMSVPDHTRNDSHPHVAGDPGSPYEDWAENFTNSNRLDTADKLLKENASVPQFSNLKEAFDYVAKYSNENFFSEETIVDTKYVYPKQDYEQFSGSSKLYYKSDVKGDYILAKRFESEKGELIYTIDDPQILSVYFSRLSRRTVLAGAGVIDLFFREAEKAKQNPNLLESPPPPPNSLGTIGTYLYTRVFSPYGAISSLLEPFSKVFLKIKDFSGTVFRIRSNKSAIIAEVIDSSPTPAIDPSQSPATETAGVEGSTSNKVESLSAENSPSDVAGGKLDVVLEDLPPPPTPDPAITKGGSSAGSLGSISAPGAGAAPPLQPVPPSAPPPPPPPEEPLPDTTPPDIAFSISECGSSISSEACLIIDPLLHISWSSTAADINHYEIKCEVNDSPCPGFSFSPTNVTSTEFMLDTEKVVYTFKAKAIDAAGNQSSETTKSAEFVSRPVIINEVAWMGTGSSATTSKDEWIELYNTASHSINLSGWALSFFEPGTTTPSKTIALSNTIPTKGFYLIERTNDSAVADIIADLTSSFGSGGLLNSGMIVKLERGGAVIDRTQELCSGDWCAGSSLTYSTMERVDPLASGETASNWGTHSDLGANIKNGVNADGGAINGTPKKRNSQNYLVISSCCMLSQNKTLTKDNSPYIIAGSTNLNISSGVTLTLEPGTVVKLSSGAEISVPGKIIAKGTAADPIVFTSVNDDTYSGDTNQNGTSTAPAAGDWRRIKITNSSEASQFDYVRIRYGGPVCGFGCPPPEDVAMFAFVSSPVDIKNSTIEHSFSDGAYFLNSSGTLSSTTFRNNCSALIGYCFGGLVVNGASITIQSNTFEANKNGLFVDGSHQVDGNIFIANTSDAVKFGGGAPTFSSNTASGNGTNGIRVAASGDNYTYEKDLTYVFQEGNIVLVAPGKTVEIKPGVVFKSNGQYTLTVNGLLKIKGNPVKPVVFTSFFDDSYGGDTNNDGVCDPGNASSTASCPGPGDWGSLVFSSGAASSTLDRFVIRYGASFCNSPCAALQVNSVPITISKATIEKNKFAGIRFENSATSSISTTIVRDHRSTGGPQSYGAVLAGSMVILNGVTFSNNDTAIAADGFSGVTLGSSGITFDGNSTDDSPADLIP